MTAREGPSLPEIATILKQELNLPPEATTATVINEACRDLEVEMEGLSLVAKARECWVVMGKPQVLSQGTTDHQNRPPSPPPLALGSSSGSIESSSNAIANVTARLEAATKLLAKTEAEAAAARMEAKAARAEGQAASALAVTGSYEAGLDALSLDELEGLPGWEEIFAAAAAPSSTATTQAHAISNCDNSSGVLAEPSLPRPCTSEPPPPLPPPPLPLAATALACHPPATP